MSRPQLLVRPAAEGDLTAIKALADDNKKALGFVSRGALLTALQAKRLIVALWDGAIVGFTEYYRRHDGQLTIYAIVVSLAYRRQGIGRAMIACLVDEAGQPAIMQIGLKCPEDLEANAFYASVGFNFVGREERPNRRGLNLWVYPLRSPKEL